MCLFSLSVTLSFLCTQGPQVRLCLTSPGIHNHPENFCSTQAYSGKWRKLSFSITSSASVNDLIHLLSLWAVYAHGPTICMEKRAAAGASPGHVFIGRAMEEKAGPVRPHVKAQ